MSDQTAFAAEQQPAPVFRGSLVRTVVIGLLLVSLIPVLIIGVASYLRTRQFMLTQATNQLATLTRNYGTQLTSLASSRQQTFSEIVSQPNFDQDMQNIFLGVASDQYYTSMRTVTNSLKSYITTPTEEIFNLLAIVDPAGTVIASSNSSILGFPLTDNSFARSMFKTNQSALLLNPGGYFPNGLVLITTMHYQNPLDGADLTLVGASTPSLLTDLLVASNGLFQSTHSFFITSDKQFAAYNPSQQNVVSEVFSQAFQDRLFADAAQSGSGASYSYTAQNNTPVMSYILTNKNVQSTLVVEVPESSIYGQLKSLLPFLLALLAGSLLLTTLFIAFGARSVVVPLVDLARHARDFASGDWSFRANIKREDEIGLLGYSFNLMVQQLTDFYHSLETRVEERTHQMRMATEIAQEAVLASSRSEILMRASKLLAEKFEFLLAAIYLLDENGQNVVLAEQGSSIEGAKLAELTRIPLSSDSLVGWVAANSQTRLENTLPEEKTASQLSYLLPASRSEITLPIIDSGTTIGVLDIQSSNPTTFDTESATIFGSFASQIAAGLRNVQMVESSRSNLQQSTLMAHSTRLISQAKTSEEVVSLATDLFAQTHYVFFFLDVLQNELQLASLTDPRGTHLDKSLKGYKIPFEKGIASLSKGSTMYVSDLAADSDFAALNSYFTRRGCTSSALIPIMEGNSFSHLIALGSRDKEPISAVQVQALSNTFEGIGAALERIHLEQSLEQRNKELSTLDAISRADPVENSLSAMLLRLHEELKKAIGSDIGFGVAMAQSDSGKMEIPYYADENTLTIEPYASTTDLFALTISKGEPNTINDATTLGFKTIDSPAVSVTTQSFLGIPLKQADRVIGAMALLDYHRPMRFTENEKELMLAIAPQVSTNIQNALLIASQIKALNAYEQEKFLFNALLDHTPDRVEFIDLSGNVIRKSQSSASLRPEENDLSELPEEVKEADIQLMESDTTVLGDVENYQTSDGIERWELVSKLPLHDANGSIAGLLTIARDITDLKNTQQLAEHRANQLLTASEIARDTSAGSQDIQELLKRLVDLVRDRFGFYHASIFLLDPLAQYAVLEESTGEAGEALKLQSHQLAVGSQSIIGQTTLLGQPVIVNDVTQAENYYSNPLLPETRSELGIPLINTGRVIGALDVQSDKFNAFTPEDVRILQVLGDQLAVAIQNAELFTRTESSLSRHRLLHQITNKTGKSPTVDDAVREAVEMLHQTMSSDQITYWAPSRSGRLAVKAYAGLPSIELASTSILIGERAVGMAALENRSILLGKQESGTGSLTINPESQSLFCVPVTYQDRLLGVLNVENLQPAAFDETDQEIITTLANNLASIISNIQLVDQVKLQVERQQQLYDISSKIRRSVDIETIMQTSVAEICTALNIKRASIEISGVQQHGLNSALEGFEQTRNEESA